MKICVIGGANADITATSSSMFVPGDSNPGKVRISFGGVARNVAHNLALLGDEVHLLTVFGSDSLAERLREHCIRSGILLEGSETVPGASQSMFLSINSPEGEMLGGVADMAILDRMDQEWISGRMDLINDSDAVVADANLSAGSLSCLIGCCRPPLFIDAVSCAKAPRIGEALALATGGLPAGKQAIAAIKCNSAEEGMLGIFGNGLSEAVGRIYVSQGRSGLKVIEKGRESHFPALECKVVNTTGGGDALLAGIVHMGRDADVSDAARAGLLCARCAVSSADAVNEGIKNLRI